MVNADGKAALVPLYKLRAPATGQACKVCTGIGTVNDDGKSRKSSNRVTQYRSSSPSPVESADVIWIDSLV